MVVNLVIINLLPVHLPQQLADFYRISVFLNYLIVFCLQEGKTIDINTRINLIYD